MTEREVSSERDDAAFLRGMALAYATDDNEHSQKGAARLREIADNILALRSSVKTVGNNDGWFALRGDERLGRCATEGCGGQPAFRLEAGGTGSDYCSGCAERIKSLSAIEVPAAEGEQIDKTLLHGICDSLRAVIMEYEDMDMFPGSRAIMQGQLDALTAALKGDRP